MIEALQTVFRTVWEIFLPIPMPWQALIVFLLLVPVMPWLVWRAFPWLFAKFFQILLLCTEVLAALLLFPEYLLTQKMRQSGKQLRFTNYVFGEIFQVIVTFLSQTTEQLHKLLQYGLTKRWLPSKEWYFVPILILPIWFLRPYLDGIPVVSKLIDNSVNFWCSFEGWIMSGQWTSSSLSCDYPNKSALWNASLKSQEYKYRREIEKYTQTLQTNSGDFKLYYNRGNIYLKLQDMESAFKDYSQAVRINSKFAPAYSGRGDVYLLLGDKKTAFKEYTQAIKIDSKFAPAYSGRGDVYLKLGDKETAFKEYTQAIRIDSDFAPAYTGRGNVYFQQKDKKAAIKEYKIAANLFQKQERIYDYQQVINLMERLK